MAGKTTLGRRIAAERDWVLISGDDLALAATGVASRGTHPALHPMTGLDYREYYTRHSVAELIAHAQAEHDALWEGMRKVIHAHSTWAPPAVIEGWQLYPRRIASLNLANVESVWLNPAESNLEARIRGNVEFHRGAANPETMIAHYPGRSFWHASEIAAQARELNLPCLA